MKRILTALFCSVVLFGAVHGNTDVRTWTWAKGKSFSAELVSYDQESDTAVFRDANGDETTVKATDLSIIDQAWLTEWGAVSELLEMKVEESGGELVHLVTTGEYPTDLYLYNPPGVTDDRARPLLILFHPSGKAYRYLMRFIDTAAELGVATVTCGTFRNTGSPYGDAEKEKELLARFKEVLPQLEKAVPHDPAKVIMGGSSGGAWRAYHYSAWVDRPWLGIFANGGWLGGERYYDLPYPAGMRVAMVNGNQDHANRRIAPASEVLVKRGSTVAVFSFEGGHQTPPPENITPAIRWILAPEEPTEEQAE